MGSGLSARRPDHEQLLIEAGGAQGELTPMCVSTGFDADQHGN